MMRLLISIVEKGILTVMRFYTAFFALLLAAPGISAAAQENLVTETVTLKHRKPSEVVALLSSPSILPSANVRYKQLRVTSDDTKHTLSARGGRQEVNLLKQMAALLDVAPETVRLQVRLLRQLPAAVGTETLPEPDEMAKAVLKTPSTTPVDVTLFGDGQAFQKQIIPRVLSDGSVAVDCRLTLRYSPDGAIQNENTFTGTRNLQVGKAPLRIGGNILSRNDTTSPTGTNYFIEITTVSR